MCTDSHTHAHTCLLSFQIAAQICRQGGLVKVEGRKAEGDNEGKDQKGAAEDASKGGDSEGGKDQGGVEGMDKGVVDDHEDNFAIVFAAMGVSTAHGVVVTVTHECFLPVFCTLSPLSWS